MNLGSCLDIPVPKILDQFLTPGSCNSAKNSWGCKLLESKSVQKLKADTPLTDLIYKVMSQNGSKRRVIPLIGERTKEDFEVI